ncbi:hypothetical protein MMC09_006495 [Bachmanniomyces sp. S44760]|nr:hypothetical protein [Bachmanniomyces sp. S44760]
MPPLTILSDQDVRTLLHSLTREDIQGFGKNLFEALHDYSTGTQETTPSCSANQPERISIAGRNGQTTLFMPASSSTSKGMKVMTISSAGVPSKPTSATTSSPTSTLPIRSRTPSNQSTSSHRSHSNHRSSSTSSRSSPTASRNGSSSTLPSTNTSASVPSASPSLSSTQFTTPKGSLTLLTNTGIPYAFINAEELTAFRTALASTLIFTRRSSVHTITVFGAGKQAYWHIRLALLLRGPEIHHVNIISRSFTSLQGLIHAIYKTPEWEHLRNANPKLRFNWLSHEYNDHARLLKEYVRDADALFCCTPSTSPLFPHEHLTSNEGRKKGRLVSLIGSYKPHMLELAPEILMQAVAPEHKHHHHRHADQGGVVVVDSLTACLKEAGEIIQAGLGPEQLVEVGELIMVKKAVMKEIEVGGQGEKGLKRWLEQGNVIYKSVGLGLMDVCVGEDLVIMAREKGVGTVVEEF